MKLILKIILIPFVFFIFYFLYLISPTSLSSEKIRFVVPLEAKQEEMVGRLKKEGFIRNENLFNFIAGLIKFPGTIEPGAYMLSRNMTAISVADTLMNHPYQKWIVLVPGLRVEQVGERLQKKFNWREEKLKDFLNSAREGYMFPDTYLINIDYSGKEVAQKLINNFNEKLDAQMQKDLLDQNIRIDTAVKIASLIERESGSDEDKALIAGIIWNRLDREMKLQIDATNQYIKGTPSDWWPHVTPSDLKVDSPYNTYIYKGLPPAPICNPSLASIEAVIYPQESDCLFYLHDPSRQIHCSKTYEEHMENIEEYLK